ncbi:hypothetical protein [Mesomycoplasma ovipneumoniae]|uniref:hypothetical protein n=1 Tax=Mesomycoplasma ovipneumoniae TaxID=29562 RepID=UPI003080B319
MSKVVLPEIIEQEIKKIIRRRKWKAFWRVFNIITFPIQILFVIIAIILRDIVGAFVLRLGQLILGFLVIGGLLAGIIRLFAYIVTGY